MNLVMSMDQFDYFRKKIFELAGISMSDVKIDLLQSRLRPRVLHKGFTSFEEYKLFLSDIPQADPEWETFINLLTTNKTDWFREPEHFDYIVEEFIPQWKLLGKKKLKVWCAASSTGEEPYTLALVLNEVFKNSDYKYEIHASDIDTKVLGLARNGVYPKVRLDQIPDIYHDGFSFGTGDISHWMKIKRPIKQHVTFFQYNLTQASKLNQQYDLIFCRNVLIYFNPLTISAVVNSLFEQAESESVLVISHSESLQTLKTNWKLKRPSLYVKGKSFIKD